MLFIESMDKIYYCPLKSNRQVDDSNGELSYKRVDSSDWNAQELEHGKEIKIKGFPKEHKVRLFGLRPLPVARIGLLPMTLLRIPLKAPEKCVPFAGGSCWIPG